MDNQQVLHSKSAISAGLEKAFQKVQQTIALLSESAYGQNSGDRWSPAEQVEHLMLSTLPIVGALGKDRDWFDQFDPPAHPDKGFTELKAYYQEVLRSGLQAPSRFRPEPDKVYHKLQQLKEWQRLEQGLLQKLKAWTEEMLDGCSLPHPALGSLTMRQMLQFTIIHTYHHLRFIEK